MLNPDKLFAKKAKTRSDKSNFLTNYTAVKFNLTEEDNNSFQLNTNAIAALNLDENSKYKIAIFRGYNKCDKLYIAFTNLSKIINPYGTNYSAATITPSGKFTSKMMKKIITDYYNDPNIELEHLYLVKDTSLEDTVFRLSLSVDGLNDYETSVNAKYLFENPIEGNNYTMTDSTDMTLEKAKEELSKMLSIDEVNNQAQTHNINITDYNNNPLNLADQNFVA